MPQNNLVTFNSILVNAIGVNSGIFVGTNSQEYWNSNNNTKCGFGTVIGEQNIVSRAINHFLDNDLIDTPILTKDFLLKEAAESKPVKDEAPPKSGRETIIKLGHKHKV